MKLILFLIILLVLIYFLKKRYENFNIQTGVKRGFFEVLNPYPVCNSYNNCFPGYYFRSEQYNLCKNKTKIL